MIVFTAIFVTAIYFNDSQIDTSEGPLEGAKMGVPTEKLSEAAGPDLARATAREKVRWWVWQLPAAISGLGDYAKCWLLPDSGRSCQGSRGILG